MYAATTKDEGNATDGRFSAACEGRLTAPGKDRGSEGVTRCHLWHGRVTPFYFSNAGTIEKLHKKGEKDEEVSASVRIFNFFNGERRECSNIG